MLCDKYDLDVVLNDNLGEAIAKLLDLPDEDNDENWDALVTFAILAEKFNVPNLKKKATAKIIELFVDDLDALEPLKECPDVMFDVLRAIIEESWSENHRMRMEMLQMRFVIRN